MSVYWGPPVSLRLCWPTWVSKPRCSSSNGCHALGMLLEGQRQNSPCLPLGSPQTATVGVVIHPANPNPLTVCQGLGAQRGSEGTIRWGRRPKRQAKVTGEEGHSWRLGRPSAESFHPGGCPQEGKHQPGQEMGPGWALPHLPPAPPAACPGLPDLRCQPALRPTLSWLPGFRPSGPALGGSWPHLVPCTRATSCSRLPGPPVACAHSPL